MRLQIAMLCVGLTALSILGTARPAPAADPALSPTPSPTPSGLPIGSVNVNVTNPNSQPTGATHVEQPPLR